MTRNQTWKNPAGRIKTGRGTHPIRKASQSEATAEVRWSLSGLRIVSDAQGCAFLAPPPATFLHFIVTKVFSNPLHRARPTRFTTADVNFSYMSLLCV